MNRTWSTSHAEVVVHRFFWKLYRVYRYRGPDARPPYLREWVWGDERAFRAFD